MPEISSQTLVMAIQAVDAKINEIVSQLSTAPEELGADLETLLLSYEKAASALEIAYMEAQKSISNIPKYETLIRKRDA